jgi:hypothetical protein
MANGFREAYPSPVDDQQILHVTRRLNEAAELPADSRQRKHLAKTFLGECHLS